MEIHGNSNQGSQANLTDNLETASQTLFVLTEHFNIVIHETDSPHPYRRHNHDDDIDIVQLGKEQGRNQNTGNDHQTTHGWRTRFLLLAFQAQVTNCLPNLLIVQGANQSATIDRGNNQRNNNSHSRTEGYILE